jgi:hypothetical protein
MWTAGATDLPGCHLHLSQCGGGFLNGYSADHDSAFIAGQIGLICANFHYQTAATIHRLHELVRDDGEALFIAGHIPTIII